MGLWSWLRSPRRSESVTDYEQLFRSNEENIRSTVRSIRLSQRRVREVRRTLVHLSGVAFAVLCAAEYSRKPRRWTNDFVAEFVAVFSLFPVIVYSAKRSIDWFFTHELARLEDRLQELKAVQDDKIAEFKKFTNFSKLRELVSKYGESADVDATAEEPEPPAAPNLVPPGHVSGDVLSQAGFDVSNFTRQRSLVDRICDYLLADGPSNRYALICDFCYTHNGLVVREDLDRIRYVCCYCGQLNSRSDQTPLQAADMDRQPSDSLSNVQREYDQRVSEPHLHVIPKMDATTTPARRDSPISQPTSSRTAERMSS